MAHPPDPSPRPAPQRTPPGGPCAGRVGRSGRWRRLWLPLALAAVGAGAALGAPLRLAVLGDSDSHGYQDSLGFPLDGPARGGARRAQSLQWTEVLARLRPQAIDLGPRAPVGVPARVARAAGWVGWSLRTPRKIDHAHNFAISGAVCDDLNAGRYRQSVHLARRIASEPQAWREAVVVIRIGINSLGTREALDRLAANADDPAQQAAQRACVDAVRDAVQRLSMAQPALRFVLVGVFNNAHWPPYLGHWRDPLALQRIERGLDRFDQGLRDIARAHPQAAFFDDRALFAAFFGGRGPDGEPAYREPEWRPGQRLRNASGDDPSNAMLADGHTGTVWNALWADHLLGLLRERFGVSVAPLHSDDIAALLRAPGSGRP